MKDTQIVRVRKMGMDRILTIPRHMKGNIKSGWMKVTSSENGSLVYEPVMMQEENENDTL
jgi:hypothetical protein